MENIHKKSELARKGETLAARHLEGQGLRILKRNWRFKHKEIDIIAENDRFLVIAEVKTRSSDYHVLPREMVPPRKQRFLIAAAQAFIMHHRVQKECRFDVVIVYLSANRQRIEYIPDAFQPGL